MKAYLLTTQRIQSKIYEMQKQLKGIETLLNTNYEVRASLKILLLVG